MKNKITIITPTFNSSDKIVTNLRSVLEQKFDNWEQIIIDNKSTDNTIEIIKKNSIKKKIKIISKKDKGIFDAINKGIKLSTGNIISILHSDDFYQDNEVLNNVVKTFENNDVEIVYGNLIYVKKENIKKIVRFWKSSHFCNGMFSKGWSPPHPSFFVKKNTHDKFGFYKIKKGNAADIELMYRFLELKKVNYKYINKTLIKMRYGGKSNNSIFQIFRQNLQIINFLNLNNPFKILKFIYFKIMNRTLQLIKK